MKVLHTSDWHIGKRLNGIMRLEAQRAVLGRLTELVRTESVGLVVLAGDVFDTAMPSADAESLFYDTVGALGALCPVLVISGNHDDADRLAAAQTLAARHGITIAGGYGPPTATRSTRAVGDGWVQLDCGGERVNAVLLPYPTDARLGGTIKEGETYCDRVKAQLFRAADACFGDGFDLTVAHLFCDGATVGGDERDITLGTARIVPLDCLPAAHYTALGHIHKPMSLRENIVYSGAPMPFTFDETGERGVTLVDTATGEAVRVPLEQEDVLVRAEAESVAEALDILDADPRALVELTLALDRPLTSEETHALRSCRTLVKLVLRQTVGTESAMTHRADLTPTELFTEYCRSRQVPLDEPLLAAFLRALGEL